MSNEITLIGAGLTGSILAIYLAKKGFKVTIYERRPDMRKSQADAGRSINLALSARGLHALEEVGLKKSILEIAIPMKGRQIHAVDNSLNFIPYSNKESEVINSVSRAMLNIKLMDAAEAHGVKVYFNQKCTGFDLGGNELMLQDGATKANRKLKVTRVIGTDGSASAIRNSLVDSGNINFSKDDLAHAYKELTIPPGQNGAFRIEQNALHIWPRKSFMLIALPNMGGSFTCTLFLPVTGEISFETLTTPELVLAFFKKHFPDAVPMMPDLVKDFFENPTGKLATVKCDPWYVEDKICLLGDAAHAIVPFYGQGINCGFEDCSVLSACFENSPNDWQTIFADLYRQRKVNTDAIAQLSLENYIEMRDSVADPKFLLKRNLEFTLEEKYPDRFCPKYSMVSFRRIPYSDVLKRSLSQNKILNELCANVDSIAALDWTLVEKSVKQLPVL